MKTAEQWRAEIQRKMGDHLSLAQEARFLELSAAAIQADAFREAAGYARKTIALNAGVSSNWQAVYEALPVVLEAEAAKLEEPK